MSQAVRVRFAPSPTGPLHIGGVRTALYNYLFAKKEGGQFILRIEDTDQNRYVDGAEDYIHRTLEWLGIAPDESPWNDKGDVGPYRQSERKDVYAKHAQQLLDEDKAYYAFDTSEELDEMRERLKAARVDTPQYNAITRLQMKNSLTLSEEEVKQKLEAGEPYVIRLKVPRKEEVRLNDKVRGWVMVHSTQIDDKILMKSDGMPTYHLANVVDDHLMGITHVIRGEEWLPSAPLHVLLYQFFGWEDTMPEFAHLPLLLKPDGNGKLSKRDAEKHGFPIFPMEWKDPASGEFLAGFKEEGYLPDALLNFLAFLGWNPGSEQEIFNLEELIEAFSLERIGKAGAKFDIQKAKWFNEQYLKNKSNSELAGYLKKDVEANGIEASQGKLERIVHALKERVTFPTEFWTQGQYFFAKPDSYDEKVVRKKWNADVDKALTLYADALDKVDHLDAGNAKATFASVLEAEGIGMGKVMQSLRVSITGQAGGPDLMEIIEILGREEITERIRLALDKLKDQISE